jgi:hypothetical protein
MKGKDNGQLVDRMLLERGKITEDGKILVKLLHTTPLNHVEIYSTFLDMQSHIANLVSLAGDASQRRASYELALKIGLMVSHHAYSLLENYCIMTTSIPLDLSKRPVKLGLDFSALGARLGGTYQRD